MLANAALPDRIIAGLTARQLILLGLTALAVASIYSGLASNIPLPVVGVICLPVAAIGVSFSLGRVERISLDRMARFALRYLRRPRSRVLAPSEVPRAPAWAGVKKSLAAVDFPVKGTHADGILDLGDEGFGLVARASAVNISLRADEEQEAIVESFGRFLNSLSGPVEILVHSGRADLSQRVDKLEESIPSLPHPLLEERARSHVEFLRSLGARGDVLNRETFLCFRDEAVAAAEARQRLHSRLHEASSLIRPTGVTLKALSAAEVGQVLARSSDRYSFFPKRNGSARMGGVRGRSRHQNQQRTVFCGCRAIRSVGCVVSWSVVGDR